jgi:hypothetical protein
LKKAFSSTHLALWANRFVALAVLVMLFALPPLLQWYGNVRQLLSSEKIAVAVGFYSCSVAVAIALWNMERLLRSILRQEVFTAANVGRIRAVQWCCAAVSLVCIPVTLFYYPMVFMTVVMGFLCLVVSVVARVMDAAVTIREENELTI